MTPAAPSLPPVRRSITVPWTPEAAFRRFTDEIATWWPLATHSVAQERAETVRFESRVGGRICERASGGEEHVWGTITAWEPPRRVAFTWHPGRDPETAQTIEVRFAPLGSGTRLELTHAGWEALGEEAKGARRGYALGWAYVLRLWAGRSSSALVVTIDLLTWALGPLLRRRARRAAALAAGAAKG